VDNSVDNLDTDSKNFIKKIEGKEVTTVTKTDGTPPEVSEKVMDSFMGAYASDFIDRAGAFTEDLLAFIIEQKKTRGLSDPEAIFGVALANINLRAAYGRPQNSSEANMTDAESEKLLEEFDQFCYGAQEYWDDNA